MDRSEVEQLTQQRVISLEPELGKEKISLARITGLAPNPDYDLTDEVPFAAAPALTVEDAIHQALNRRDDIKAAQSQIRAAERTLAAARDERLPSLTVNGNYGALGTNPLRPTVPTPLRSLSVFPSGREAAPKAPSSRHRPRLPSAKPNSKTSRARSKASFATPGSHSRPQPVR